MSKTELAKQLQSLVAGALPLVAAKIQFMLPFLNPQITEDQWPITSLLALVSSGVTYNLAQHSQMPRGARILALLGLVTAVASIILLIVLVDNLFLRGSPEMQDALTRSLFVFLFVGVGLALGWCSAQIL
jgi:hypothetical protein